MQPPDLIAPFVERLAALDVPYMVTGSTAGILYGEPRMTNDVDIVVALRVTDVEAFVAAFAVSTDEIDHAELERLIGERGLARPWGEVNASTPR